MLEKRTIFNSTVVSKEEYDSFKKTGFISEKGFKVEKAIYKALFIFFTLFFAISLILFYKLRNSYIIRQRGFILSFTGGIITYIYIIFGFLPQLTMVPCPIILYPTVLVVLVHLIFFCRSFKIILSYYFNIYKVTSFKRGKFNKRKSSINEEPNSYLQKIFKKINIILAAIIIIPTVIILVVTIILNIKNKEICSISEKEDSLLSLKENKSGKLFKVVQIWGGISIVLGFITTILLCFIKDANNFGAKFECVSVSILILIFGILNMILQININSKSSGQRRMLLDFYEVTKGGKLLFTIVAIYILFTSITLPLIKYYLAKRNKVRNSDDITKSKDYFKKVLNTPSLVFILRNIAIKEFSVENVLFWENYQILQNMNYRFYNESKKVKETDDDGYIRLTNDYDYDYDGYYQQQIQSIAVDPMNNYSYVPDTPVPKEILPYYQNFFKTFIHRNGKAAVNIPDSIAKVIQGEMTFPTIGIFDSAKEEVIEMMYNSIYPIFLQNYKSQLDETFA